MFRQFLVGGGVSLINIAIHALIMTMVVQVARAMGMKQQSHSSLVLIAVMIPTISVLMAAHVIEVFVWALAYLIFDAAPAGASLVYFAFVNYATLGYGDVLPVERWRLLGPLTRWAVCCYLDGRPQSFSRCYGELWCAHSISNECPLLAQNGHSGRAQQCLLLGVKRTSLRHALMSASAQSGLRMIGQITALGELQRLEICNSLRLPIHVLARSASAWLAAAVLPRALYNSASPK